MTTRRTLATLACMLLGNNALAVTQSGAGPAIGIHHAEFNFGYIPQGAKVYHTYYVRNDGSDTLRITGVKPSCGCTTVPLSRSWLLPGDSVALDLEFKSLKFNGVIGKRVKITSNDPNRREAFIFLNGRVNEEHPYIEVSPAVVDLREIGVHSRTLEVTNTSEDSASISVVSPPPDYLEVTVSDTVVAPAAATGITFKLIRQPPPGEFFASITIELTGRTVERVTIPIKGLAFIE